jgi:hypothetical protein
VALATRRPAPVVGPPAAAVLEVAVVTAAAASPREVAAASGGIVRTAVDADRYADPAVAGPSFAPPNSLLAPRGVHVFSIFLAYLISGGFLITVDNTFFGNLQEIIIFFVLYSGSTLITAVISTQASPTVIR